MKNTITAIAVCFLILFGISCTTKNKTTRVIKGKDYELTIAGQQKAVLILFPCFPCDLENTKTEARFLNHIAGQGITTLLLNYNQKLFLSEPEKSALANELNTILDQNKVAKETVFIGGFSGGGNVALLLSSYLIKTKKPVQPKGLFIVDSPLDLEHLYCNAQSDIAKNVDTAAVEEGKYLTALLEQQIGKPDTAIEKYKTVSPYLVSCDATDNLVYLKNIKTRFYCEPDLAWQNQQKSRTYEELNAYVLEKASQSLSRLGSRETEFIATKNRGIRADGTRHPHSWNLVEQHRLVKWMIP